MCQHLVKKARNLSGPGVGSIKHIAGSLQPLRTNLIKFAEAKQKQLNTAVCISDMYRVLNENIL